ncbi:MAG: hypothetical protein Q7U80_10890, partial [Thiobacillus sp.]|nr:hypothetical protein [Thiobacillus sp.]
MIGNRGNDSLYGGTGVDTFRLTIGGGSDQIFEESGETSIVELYGQDLTRLSGTRMGDDLLLNISGSSESMTLKDYFTQTHDWQVKDTEGTVRVLDDLLTENATRNASLGEMDRLEERFVGSIKDAATQYFLDRGLAPQADGSWLSQPDFQVTKLFYDRERLPGWNGYVPADSAYYYFNNSPHYETGSFGLSVYSSDAIEMWPEDFGDPSYASWQLVPSKVQVTWSAQSQSTPKQTMNYVTGGYQYNEWQLMAILQSLQAINPSIAGISNRYIYTSTPTYTEQTTTTNLLGTVLSIAPDDGSGYNIDTANPASLFNLASLPNTLSVSLGVFTQERKLQVVEGGDSDNTIDFSDFYADIIVHAGTGNDT